VGMDGLFDWKKRLNGMRVEVVDVVDDMPKEVWWVVSR
jgi:hypothetical protein